VRAGLRNDALGGRCTPTDANPVSPAVAGRPRWIYCGIACDVGEALSSHTSSAHLPRCSPKTQMWSRVVDLLVVRVNFVERQTRGLLAYLTSSVHMQPCVWLHEANDRRITQACWKVS
jgi:hypothetical protein